MFCERIFKENLICKTDKSIKDNNKKNMLNCINFKKVRFNNIIDIMLIPCRYEYFECSIDTLLWWKNEDYNNFKKNFLLE